MPTKSNDELKPKPPLRCPDCSSKEVLDCTDGYECEECGQINDEDSMHRAY